jgi:hypothetical protein
VNIRPPDGVGEVTISAFHGMPPEADFARKLPPVFVLITANAPPQQFKERGDEYGRITESLRLRVPKAPGGP